MAGIDFLHVGKGLRIDPLGSVGSSCEARYLSCQARLSLVAMKLRRALSTR